METSTKGKIRNAAEYLLLAGAVLTISAILAMVEWDIGNIKLALMTQKILILSAGLLIIMSAFNFMRAVKE